MSKYRALLPYIEAQARLETNNFQSNVYKTDHNLFGMKFIPGTNTKRDQVATRGLKSTEGDYYAHYLTDSSSVADLLKWMDYKNFPTSVSGTTEYASELKKRGYYGASIENYIAILNRFIK